MNVTHHWAAEKMNDKTIVHLNPYVKHIYLRGQTHVDDEKLKRLTEALSTNSVVDTLHVAFNSITSIGVLAVAEMIKINTTITSLNIEDDDIGDWGVEALANALGVNSSITSIAIGGKLIYSDGIGAIADALKVNSTIRQFRLWNASSDSVYDVYNLAEAIACNTSITSFSFSTTAIGNDGLRRFSDAFRINTSLTHVHFAYDGFYRSWAKSQIISDIGAMALANALQVNQSIAFIDLTGNYITDTGIDYLAQQIKHHNLSVTSIVLTQNRILHCKTYAALEDCLNRHVWFEHYMLHDIIYD